MPITTRETPSPEYVTAATKQFEALVHRDRHATYIPYAINHGRFPHHSSDPFSDRRRILIRITEAVSAALHPHFSRSNAKRNDQTHAFGVIVLPASVDSKTHLHGWCRVPLMDTRTRSVCIYQHQQPIQVVAPSSLATFTNAVAQELHTTNIWYAHDGTRVQSERATGFRMLDYLERTKPREIRQWDALEYLPTYLFARLECA